MKGESSRVDFLRFLQRTLTAGFLTTLLISQPAFGGNKTLESVVRNNPDYSLFSDAMDRTGFWKRLAKEGPVTLFIPTDQAMKTEGSDFLLNSVLLAKENRARLEELISLHITTDPYPLDVSSGYVRTLNGDCLLISRLGSALKVGAESFVVTSINIDNNRLIAIDRLLVPNYLSTVECTSTDTAYSHPFDQQKEQQRK